jgi:tetratricopeptide (TPR) repeat protein
MSALFLGSGEIMRRLGDAPTDLLFGLIALNNDLVAPAVIPAALRGQALEPNRKLAELLVTQGALTTAQRELVEMLSGEYINRYGGDAGKALAALIATPSAHERLDRLDDHELSASFTSAASVGPTVSLTPAASLGSPVPDEPDPLLDETTLPPPANAVADLPVDATALPPPANAVADAKLKIADYEILEVLGIGGMGIVYKARHRRLDRFVALKMIRAGSSARPEDLAPFEIEAKAVATIDHSNMVKIFEIGEHDGLPYFSLEFLPGGTLAAKIGGQPQPADEAARIVEVLARAMHVAHQHKVIHRDLKPGNVLFAADGTVKISDFGLVKRLEGDSGQTRSGSVLGTPSYMAPEQARGENETVGPAADQYALGAILYELLTGRPPFQGTSVLDTLEMVCTREPVPPSQLQPKTPRDLETICLKCLEKEVSRRYPDVLALAEDLHRFRAGETILARPVSDAERFWRWCHRNPRVAFLSTAVALLLLIVAAGSAIAAVIFSGQNQALGKAKTLAEEKQRRAVAAARAANEQNRSAVDAQVDQIRLLEGKLRFVPAIQNEREQLLDKAVARLQAAAQAMTELRRDVEWAPEDEGRNWRSLASAHFAMGRLSLSRNQVAIGMTQFQQAEEIIATRATADPEILDLQVNWIRIERQLGEVSMTRLGDTERAQRYLRRAIEISRACVAKKPDQDIYKSELANSLGQLAGSELTLGHLKEARELYREEVDVRKSFSPAEANRLEDRRELASLYAQRAQVSVRAGNLAEGQRFYDECASMRAQIAAENPDYWPAQNDLALSYNQQGSMRFPQGRDAAAARQLHRKALLVLEKRTKAEPSDLENKHALAETLYYEATCALHSGDKYGSEAGFRRCLAICKELMTDPKAKVWERLRMLALGRCGEHAQAARMAQALVATPPKDDYLYVVAACGYALAAGAAGGDASLVQRYKTKALDCLRNAKERGWNEVASLEKYPDLEPIRNDQAFQALLREFRGPGEKPQ